MLHVINYVFFHNLILSVGSYCCDFLFPKAKRENISFRETKILFIFLNETLNATLRS